MKAILCIICCWITLNHWSQNYQPDILGNGFEQLTIHQPDDYEGKITCTVIRKKTANASKKAVLYVHGFNDYFFQAELANWYNAHGYNFYAVDLRKYGRSILPNHKMNNVRDLKEYFADLDTALRIIQTEGSTTVLLNGHSTGGLICTYYAQEHPNSELFHSMFLNSPFFEFNESKFKRKFGVPFISKRALKKPDKLKKGGFTKWYGYSLHTSEHGQWDYNLTWKPHIAPSVNYGWIRAIHEAQLAVRTGKEITVPTIVIFSMKSVYPKKWSDELYEGDAILNVEDIRRVSELLNCKSINTIQMDGLLHDVVLSPHEVKVDMYNRLGNWLKVQL
jgi:alpha-beta hydrolase superfamily lysophospholipase